MPLSSAHTHFNKLLTGFSVEFTPPEHVADLVVKPYSVTNDSDVYAVYDKTAFNIVNDVRADGAPENEIDMGWGYDAYMIEPHGLKSKITQKMRRNNDSGVDLESQVTETLKRMICNGLEQRVFGAGGVLRATANNTHAANLDWTNLATATPRANVETAINAVEEASGRTPNTIVLTPKVARHIMATTDYKSERQYTVDLSTQSGASDLPAQFYGMRAVYVGALLNTTKKGQAATLSRLMGDDVWLGFIHPGETVGEKVLTHSARLWTEEYVRKWWDDEIESDWIAYNLNYVCKVVAKECGAILQSVLTA
jgi:hypothetical protein